MNPSTPQPPREALDLADLLISRVVDGQASPRDWSALDALAGQHPLLWKELAMAQAQDRQLRAELAPVAHAAESIALPTLDHHDPHQPFTTETGSDAVVGRVGPGLGGEPGAGRGVGQFEEPSRRLGAWGGWAAAAVLALAFIAVRPEPMPRGPDQSASLSGSIQSAADAFNLYLEKGKRDGTVLEELPQRYLLRTEPAPDGNGYDVVYLRQIVERTRVQGLYREAIDERGQPAPAPVIIPAPAARPL